MNQLQIEPIDLGTNQVNNDTVDQSEQLQIKPSDLSAKHVNAGTVDQSNQSQGEPIDSCNKIIYVVPGERTEQTTQVGDCTEDTTTEQQAEPTA